MGAGGMAAAIVLASNMVSSGAQAWIDFTIGGALVADGGVEVTASDAASIDATTSLESEVSPTNDLGAGILNGLVGAFLDDYEFTSHSGMQFVAFGDKVRTDDGTVYEYMGEDATIDLDEGAEDYSVYGFWKPLSETSLLNDAVTYAALSALGTVLGVEAVGPPTPTSGSSTTTTSAARSRPGSSGPW